MTNSRDFISPSYKEYSMTDPNTSLICFEGITSVSAIINSIKIGVCNRKIIKVLFDKDRVKSDGRRLTFLKASAKELGYTVELTNRSYIDEICEGHTHGGIAALCSQRVYPSTTDSIDKLSKFKYIVYMDGIEDPYNFGNAIRSFYASGVDAIIMSDVNRMVSDTIVARSSAGTSEMLPMFVGNISETAEMLKQKGFKVVSSGIRDSVSIYDADLSFPVLLVVGGEKRGISRVLLDISDEIVRIDYARDFKGSLSSAASAAVFAFEIMKQNK